MRVVITGVTGNVGSALVHALDAAPETFDVVGIARRRPPAGYPIGRFVAADLARDGLDEAFEGADAVVHLAWEIQPSRDRNQLWRSNVLGTRRVLDAVVEAGVPRLVVASSIGVYGPGPKTRLVDESWPRGGIPSSTYSTHKAEIERLLDAFETSHADARVIRLRPALIFQRSSASEQRRLFAGPFVPGRLLRAGRLPILPDVSGLRFQAVHAKDVAEAYRLALVRPDARGAYNVAAPPVLDMPTIAGTRRARTVRVPRRVARGAFAAAYALRLHPSEPSWLDVGLDTPLVSSERIAMELGWQAQRSALDTINEVVDGLVDGTGGETTPLAPDTGLAGRLREIREGIGSRVSGRF
ncbi:MAG TPA: NAD-dependent epimerase/dehydratase family protein [Gaiellales bacterium]|jgi:nucleoside-diphosphate-sugar epimerase